MSFGKNENKQKEAGVGPLFVKNWILFGAPCEEAKGENAFLVIIPLTLKIFIYKRRVKSVINVGALPPFDNSINIDWCIRTNKYF